MTPGDEAGALREEEETQVDSADSAADAHDDPAPAEPDPGATVETDASAEAAPAEAASAEDGSAEDGQEAPVVKTRAEKKAEKAAAKAEKARLKAEQAAAAARAPGAPAPAPEQSAESDAPGESDVSGESDEADEEAEADGILDEEESPRPAGAWAISVAALVVLLIAGLVTAGLYWNKASSASADASGKQAAISTAETAVTDLFTIDYKKPDAWSANLKKLAAGQFLGVISNSSSAFAKIIPEGKVETTGKAQLAGVESYKGDTAQVAVLGYEIIKNSQNPQGSERPYHMVLSVIKSGSKWVVSNLEFVQ